MYGVIFDNELSSKIIYNFFHSLAFYHTLLLLQSLLMTGWYMAYKILMGKTWTGFGAMMIKKFAIELVEELPMHACHW